MWIWESTVFIYAHFPKDRNCEICQRTKITRAPCRRRIGRVVFRAENFGDLIAADHKVVSEGCESRNNHRYAVVVQDLATQWIQSYPCKTKICQETERSLQKFLEPNRKPKVFTLTILGIWQGLWRSFLDTTQIGNKCDCWGSSAQSETRYVCCIVAIRSGWEMVGRFHGLRNTQDLLSGGKTPHERRWPGGWGPQGRASTEGGGFARVPNRRVCKHPDWRGGTQGRKDELTFCRGTV